MESLERGVFSRGLKLRKNVTKCGKVLTGGSNLRSEVAFASACSQGVCGTACVAARALPAHAQYLMWSLSRARAQVRFLRVRRPRARSPLPEMVPGFAVALARRSRTVAPTPKITTGSGPAHARHQRCPGCCAPFMTFFVFAIILIPLTVFAVAAFFAVLLWWIECDAYMLDVAADLASGEGSDMCSFYEWWLYIVGNLVGVSVADVTVESNHAFSAILDLLISVWSLAVAGLVVGLLASLSWVTLIAEGADSSLTRGFQKAFGNEGVAVGGPAGATGSLEGSQATGSLEWSQFLELCLKKEINLEVAHLRELYDHAHRDENGSINADRGGAAADEAPLQGGGIQRIHKRDAEPNLTDGHSRGENGHSRGED